MDQNQIWTKIPNFTPFRSGEKNKKLDQNMKQNSKIGLKFKGQNSIFGSKSKVEQKLELGNVSLKNLGKDN